VKTLAVLLPVSCLLTPTSYLLSLFPSRSRHGKTIPNPKSRLSLAEGSPVPLVACPKCATNLKIPDGSSGNVKCPKCGTIFPVAAKPAAAPAFEVVEDAPAPAPRPAAKPQPIEPDFEVLDEPKPKKKVVALDDDDDDDRPRSKRRRDDEDDDDDDRPRKKKKKRRDYDDYDDDDDWRPTDKGSSFGPAKVGMLMVSISLWMYASTFALFAFFLLIAWLGASIPNGLMIVTGLLGLANWVVGLIGLGFCIAGPSKSRGLAIAATAVAAVHLVMAFVVANNEKTMNIGAMSIGLASGLSRAERLKSLGEKVQKETDPARRREYEREARELIDSLGDTTGIGRTKSEMRWHDLATLIPISDLLIANLAYESKTFDDYVLGLLAGLLEVARGVLIILLMGAVARAARDHDVAGRSMMSMIVFSIGIGVAMIVWLIISVIGHESKPSSSTSSRGGIDWLIGGALIVFLVHLGTLVYPAVLALGAKNAAARRAR